jgi:hypothetical protein
VASSTNDFKALLFQLQYFIENFLLPYSIDYWHASLYYFQPQFGLKFKIFEVDSCEGNGKVCLGNQSRYFRTGYGRKNRFLEMSRNQVWNRVDYVLENLIFKAGITSFLCPLILSPENRFHDRIDSHSEIDSVESILGVLNSLKIQTLKSMEIRMANERPSCRCFK